MGLVFKRKPGQRFVIDGKSFVEFVRFDPRSGCAVLDVEAPRDVVVDREEVHKQRAPAGPEQIFINGNSDDTKVAELCNILARVPHNHGPLMEPERIALGGGCPACRFLEWIRTHSEPVEASKLCESCGRPSSERCCPACQSARMGEA